VLLAAKNRAEAPLSAVGWRLGRLVGLAKNAPSIRKLLKIVAKPELGEAIKAGSVLARSHVSTAGVARAHD
jgi:hypothetical protein